MMFIQIIRRREFIWTGVRRKCLGTLRAGE
jgi:hypothetical protein